MTIEQARAEFTALQAKISAYNHAMGLLSFDGETTAPRGTADNRAQTLSILSEETYRLLTGEETVTLLELLDEHREELSEKEQRMVYLMLKNIRETRKIPLEEYVAYQRLLVQSESTWRTAKETNDFSLLLPYLEEVFAAHIRFAGYIAPEKNVYDFWLGQYEDGLTQEVCDRFFDTLRARLVPLLHRVAQQEQVDDRIVWGRFPVAQQEKLSEYLMELIGLDREHCGLAVTEHPFTTSLGSHFDERITTHYLENNFVSSLYSVVHEGGHALYDMGSADELAYTVLDGGVSMGIHESQSRFYENLLGRSRAFVETIFPKLQELFPEQLAGRTADELYRAVNRAQPSLIRTEADEVTYCLHVMVRYELEKQVLSGALAVRELPEAWNRLYREYLGVEVPTDRQGVLQDTHWASGLIGYFPSYALGSAYGAQFLKKMKQDVDVDACVRAGDFGPINEWSREHIWKHGSLYKPGQLLDRVLGEEFDPNVYLDYLEEKCRDVYSLS